jgi:hypothetical protein
MRILNMIMPKIGHEITVKFIKAPYRVGNDVFADVRIFGDMARNTYRMKIGKSLWLSLHDQLKVRTFWAVTPDEEIDKNLEVVVGKIFTISAIHDPNRLFEDKTGNLTGAKIFKVQSREELEQAEKEGEESFTRRLQTEVVDNVLCHDCYSENMSLADEEEQKAKDREEKKAKQLEKSKEMKKLSEFQKAKPKQKQERKHPDVIELWS